MADLNYILGNEIIKNHFRTAVRNQKVSHAYIIEGEKGSGKKMLAAAFSKILQCESKKDRACNICTSCIQITNKDHPDVIWVTHEKPNVISVGEIREQVVNTIDIKPYKGPYKIYIVDEAEKLNPAAQNAILKTIEEPPEYALIILLASNKGIFLPTILSRCIQLSVKPVPARVIKNYLIDQYTLEEQMAEFYASFSMGNVGKAIESFTSEEFNLMKDRLLSILREIQESAVYQIYESLKEIKKQKNYFGVIFDILTIWYHDILLLKSGASEKMIIFQEEYLYINKQVSCLEYENINMIIERIAEARAQIKANVSAESVMESLFIDIKSNYHNR